MSRLAHLAVAVLLALPLFAGCGGDDESPSSTAPSPTSPAPSEEPAAAAPTAYLDRMRPIVTDVGRALRGADLGDRRDFDRGVALLRARRAMARVTADPALLLAHDRLSRALAQGGTLLVSEPGSAYEQAAKQAGRPIGPRGAVATVAPALSAWAFETSEKLRAASAPVPSWLEREKASADRLNRRAAP
ncbi:MAG TPA: hypothetical protein VF587_07330 [Solirubrobacteraceae bacterium]